MAKLNPSTIVRGDVSVPLALDEPIELHDKVWQSSVHE
jgi:hypothetical protein